MRESVQCRLTEEPLAPSPIYAPPMSTTLSLYSAADSSSAPDKDKGKSPSTLQVPSKRRKG